MNEKPVAVLYILVDAGAGNRGEVFVCIGTYAPVIVDYLLYLLYLLVFCLPVRRAAAKSISGDRAR